MRDRCVTEGDDAIGMSMYCKDFRMLVQADWAVNHCRKKARPPGMRPATGLWFRVRLLCGSRLLPESV